MAEPMDEGSFSKGAPGTDKLEGFFGKPVPDAELEIWAAIPPSKRDKALQRLVALDRHARADGAVSAKQAAQEAGVTLGRFYQMARAWSEKRSLASVGAFASTTQTRQRIEPEVAQALQAAVVEIVAANPNDSVAALVRRLAEQTGAKKAPNTLRPFVERELRRIEQKGLAGQEIQFDCTATSLRRVDGSHHVAFLVIDAGSSMIIGHSIGDVSSSAAGYAAAAADSRSRILKGLLPRNIWAAATERSQLVPGTDVEALAALSGNIRNELGGVAPQLLRAGSYGRYARQQFSLKIGPIRLLPNRTVENAPPTEWKAADGLSASDAQARMELAVSAHNGEVLSGFSGCGAAEAPGEMIRLLELVSQR